MYNNMKTCVRMCVYVCIYNKVSIYGYVWIYFHTPQVLSALGGSAASCLAACDGVASLPPLSDMAAREVRESPRIGL